MKIGNNGEITMSTKLKVAAFALLLVMLPLAGCLTSNGSFPPCDASAPRHLHVDMGWTADSSDAGVVAQSATLQGWTNVVVNHPIGWRDSVDADCVKGASG
jgi:hypothetical protein